MRREQTVTPVRARSRARLSLVVGVALLSGCQLVGSFENFSEGSGGSGAAATNGGAGLSGATQTSAGDHSSAGTQTTRGGNSSGAGTDTGGSSLGGANGGEGGAESSGTAGVSGSGGKGGVSGSAGTFTVGGGGTGGSAPRCGNGLVEKGEVCDDGNTSACGQCSAMCSQLIQPAFAIGKIQAEEDLESYLRDGDTFTLNDGTHPAVVFEFDKSPANNGVKAGHIAVAFTGVVPSAAAIATAVGNAIASVAAKVPAVLDITVSSMQSQIVNLKHRYATSLGNQAITSSTALTAARDLLLLEGMAGGAANDCANGVGCAYAGDCAPGLKCSAATEKCVPGP